MKKKKIIARIGAIVACVLLVGALAIPAFAAYDESVTWPPTASAKTIFRQHYLPDDMNTPTLTNLEVFMGDRFWVADTLIGGKLGAYYLDTVTSFGSLNDLCFRDTCYWAFSAPDVSAAENGRMELYFNLDRIQIRLYNSSFVHAYSIQYWVGTLNGRPLSYLENIRDEINGTNIPVDSNMYLYFAFSTSAVYPDLLNEFMFNTTVLHPNAFYRGLTNGIEASYEQGYEQGKIDGINTIKDGEFGEQFIGSVFRAPFDALRNFTLVEWQYNNGTTFTITLATVVSAGIGIALFIWFLKLFAGG